MAEVQTGSSPGSAWEEAPARLRGALPGFEGGWRAMMKAQPKKKKDALVDDDMALMEKLDEGPPLIYEAWKPEDDATPAMALAAGETPVADASPRLSSAVASLSAAAASLDDDSLLQLHWQRSRVDSGGKTKFRLLASETKAAAIRAASPPADDGVSRLITETVSQETDKPDAVAVSAVLGAYADVLNSKPLRQLSRTHLNRESLLALYERMQRVDADGSAQEEAESVSVAQQVQQAEQWCLRFHKEGAALSPVLVARTHEEATATALSEAAAQRDAARNEGDAHRQLLKTAKLDGEGLAALLQTVQRSYDPIALELEEWQERAAALGLGAGGGESSDLYKAAGVAQAALSQARSELTKAIASAIRKRTGAEERQRLLLRQVSAEEDEARRSWSAMGEAEQQARSALGSAVQSLTGVEAMCDQALEAANARKHAVLREVSAVGMSLSVLGTR